MSLTIRMYGPRLPPAAVAGKVTDNRKNIFLFAHFFDTHDPYGYCENEIYPGYNDDYFQHFQDLKDRYKLDFSEERPYREEYRNVLKNLYAESDITTILEEYIKGVAKFDTGRFHIFIETLSKLGMLENSLLVIFSDHGEGLMSMAKCIMVYRFMRRWFGFPSFCVYPAGFPKGFC